MRALAGDAFPSSQRRARSASPIGRSLKSGCAELSEAQTGWREARARQGEASIEDRRNLSAGTTPALRATPARRGMMTERFPAIRVTMLPRDTNAHGTIFGGVILSYIDLAGGIECRRRSPKKFVTKAMHEVVFVAPVHLGDLVTFYTRTIRTGHTSITVGVEVEVERLGLGGTKEIVRVTEAEVIYVAVGDDGKPIPVQS